MQQHVTQNAVLIGGLFRSDWSQRKEAKSYEFVSLKVSVPINKVKLLSLAVNHFRGKKERKFVLSVFCSDATLSHISTFFSCINEFCCGPHISSLDKRYRNEEIRTRQANVAFEDVPVLSVDCNGQKALQ